MIYLSIIHPSQPQFLELQTSSSNYGVAPSIGHQSPKMPLAKGTFDAGLHCCQILTPGFIWFHSNLWHAQNSEQGRNLEKPSRKQSQNRGLNQGIFGNQTQSMVVVSGFPGDFHNSPYQYIEQHKLLQSSINCFCLNCSLKNGTVDGRNHARCRNSSTHCMLYENMVDLRDSKSQYIYLNEWVMFVVHHVGMSTIYEQNGEYGNFSDDCSHHRGMKLMA